MLNTHTLLKELIAIGLSEKTAEDFVDNIVTKDQLIENRDQLATKNDLKISMLELRGEMAELKTELKTEIAELRTELKTEIAEFRAEMRSDRKWAMAILTGIFLLGVKIAFFN